MNKGFVKLGVLLASVLALVGVAVYLVSARNANATFFNRVEKDVSINTPELNCGSQEVILTGSLDTDATLGDWLVVKVDGQVVLEKEVFAQDTSWQTDPISLGIGEHDVEVILYNDSSKQTVEADASTKFEIEACPPYIEVASQCGQVTLDFYNDTKYYFDFDYRVDGEIGHGDEVTGQNIANGPFAGQPFGERYNEVPVDGRPQTDVHHVQKVLNFDEDSGTHLVEYRLWRGAENDWYIPWESVEVGSDCDQPAPEQPKSEPSPAGAPVCPNGVPALVPSNPHVIRNGSTATVNAHIPEGDRVNIYYRENSASDWTHALRDVPVTGKYLSAEINDLNPSLGYTFGIQAANGCAGGETVLAVIIDPPANGEVFTFSYWLWQ